MNKLLRITAVVGATIAFFSCNNGAYDARPDKNEGKNPLNPNSDVKTVLGTIKVKINGIEYLFQNGYYRDTIWKEEDKVGFEGPGKYCEARLPNDPLFQRKIQLFGFTMCRDEGCGDVVGVDYSFFDTSLDSVVTYVDQALRKKAINAYYLKDDVGNLYGKIADGEYFIKGYIRYEEDRGFIFFYPEVKYTVIRLSGDLYLPKR